MVNIALELSGGNGLKCLTAVVMDCGGDGLRWWWWFLLVVVVCGGDG